VLSYDELTPPEPRVWDAFTAGRPVDLRTGSPEDDNVAAGRRWGPERSVRAEVLTALLLGDGAARTPEARAAALRLTGARITGTDHGCRRRSDTNPEQRLTGADQRSFTSRTAREP